MNPAELAKAIKFLKPNSEFRFQEADYSTIEWDVLEGDAPTLAQVEAAHIAVEEAEAQAQAAREAKRTAALAKLEALGLDEDDLKALGL